MSQYQYPNTMLKNRGSFYLPLALLLAIGCTRQFDDVNTDPNAPESVDAALLLPRILRDATEALLLESWSIGSLVIQHTAKSQQVEADRYVWDERHAIWDAAYDNLRDVANIIAQSEATQAHNYLGVALVLRAWLFGLLTDCYGDVPYSEALRAREGINYPRYDSQEQVYQGIIRELERANALIGSTDEVLRGDVLFQGNTQKWKRLANALRVRYLMRISAKQDVAAALQLIIANPDSMPLLRSNADNAVMNYRSNPPDQFPFYRFTPGFFNEFRASKGLLELMVEYNDTRLNVFYRPTPATENTANPQYAGIPNGLPDNEALAYNGGLEHQSRISAYFYEDAITPRGLQVAKGVIMTFAELQFLLAEAAEKGYITGNASDFYRQGIRASFEYYGLDATAYLNSGLTNYTGPREEKLKQIGFQKWIALYMQGLEAWFEWRRTSNPNLLPAESNQNENRIPVRFAYPRREQVLNTRHYIEAIQRQGPDNINTRMWHLKL